MCTTLQKILPVHLAATFSCKHLIYHAAPYSRFLKTISILKLIYITKLIISQPVDLIFLNLKVHFFSVILEHEGAPLVM